MLDRLDLHSDVPPVDFHELSPDTNLREKSESNGHLEHAMEELNFSARTTSRGDSMPMLDRKLVS